MWCVPPLAGHHCILDLRHKQAATALWAATSEVNCAPNQLMYGQVRKQARHELVCYCSTIAALAVSVAKVHSAWLLWSHLQHCS
jgi:hypothetical protein